MVSLKQTFKNQKITEVLQLFGTNLQTTRLVMINTKTLLKMKNILRSLKEYTFIYC